MENAKKFERAAIGNVSVYCRYDALEKTAALKPNPKNPNVHPEKQIKLLSKIISEQGFRVPITVSKRSGFIVRGHGRLLAAQGLGLAEVPVEYQDYGSDAEEYADLIADNKLAELSEIDKAVLDSLIVDLSEVGFDIELAAVDVHEFDATDPGDEGFEKMGSDEKQFGQITFVLHKEQREMILRALEVAKDMGPFENPINENQNGNALSRICELFISKLHPEATNGK